MTDLPPGPPAEAAASRAPDSSGRFVAGLYAARDVLLSLAPYGLVIYTIGEAMSLNDPSFSKGLVQGLFAAALLAINPRAPHKGEG